jgi:hypothetical protein
MQSSPICRFTSKPGGCRYGDNCRFQHAPENKSFSHKDTLTSTNNQTPPPDYNTIRGNATPYTRDTRYYCPDDTGIFLVEGVLFKASFQTLLTGINPLFFNTCIIGYVPSFRHNYD